MEEKPTPTLPKHPIRAQVRAAMQRCLDYDVGNVMEFSVVTDEDGMVTTTIVLTEQAT